MTPIISIPVDITPPLADDSLEEPRERRVRFEPLPALPYSERLAA